MTATPTPGDLSARLQKLSDACLSRRLTPAECGEFHDCIAALSALPAAGGEVCRVCGGGPGNFGVCLCGEHDYTTPQPSAAVLEDGGPPCSTHPDAPHGFNRNASHTEDRYVCDCEGWKPDADVGAQGEEWAMTDAEIEQWIGACNYGNARDTLRHYLRLRAAPAAGKEEMSPEFTDSARAAIAWVLYHHQGGSSAIGQPLRFALGMGNHEPLPEWRIAEAKAWAEVCGETENFRREAALTRQPVAGDGMDDATVSRASEHYLTARHNQVGHHDAFRSALQVALCAPHGGQ